MQPADEASYLKRSGWVKCDNPGTDLILVTADLFPAPPAGTGVRETMLYLQSASLLVKPNGPKGRNGHELPRGGGGRTCDLCRGDERQTHLEDKQQVETGPAGEGRKQGTVSHRHPPPSLSPSRRLPASTGFLPGSGRMLCRNAWEREHPSCPLERERASEVEESRGKRRGGAEERGADMASKDITASAFVGVSKDITGG